MANVEIRDFGKTKDGSSTRLFRIGNSSGAEICVSDYGARWVSAKVPDREGVAREVLLGFDGVAAYEADDAYKGATVGRVANRIGGARFCLDGKEYRLAANNGSSTLHGGTVGFDRKIWKAEAVSRGDAEGVEFVYMSPDLEEGFPGNLRTVVRYWLLRERNVVEIEHEATTDAATVVNLSNHAYFNLDGRDSGEGILGHGLRIFAERFTPVGEGLVPTGEVAELRGTVLDFGEERVIGERIGAEERQLVLARGYDHNYVIEGEAGELRAAAVLVSRESGIELRLGTSAPGLQLYTGNYLEPQNGGVALEPQGFPDAVNCAGFPSCVLRPGERYRQVTRYEFGVR